MWIMWIFIYLKSNFVLIKKITISSILIGLKFLVFPNSLAKLLSDSLLYGKFVIGQFSKPITFKVVA